jgi:cobalt-zinc-cadmium efflux system protein
MDGHEHHHHEHASRKGRAFVIGIILNLAIVVVEVVFGLGARSMALLADAGHNLGDVLGLVLAGGAALLAQRKPTKRHTYGLRRLTLLAALANAILLLVATGGVTWEAIRRLASPEPVQTTTVLVVAAISVVVNAASASLFFAERSADLNVRAAFLHLAGDAAIGLGVILATLVLRVTGWTWVDSATAIAVSLLIVASTWSLLRKSAALVLDAVPDKIDIDAVKAFLSALPRVREVHDLHIWAMSTTETALTAHLVMPGNTCEPAFLGDVCKGLHDRFGIEHATLQLDPEEAPDPCKLAPEDAL